MHANSERQNQAGELPRSLSCVSSNIWFPLAQVQGVWLERKFNAPGPLQPWQKRSWPLTLTFSPVSISISHSSPIVNSLCSTLEPVVTVILNFFPSCTISEMLLMSLPFWIWSSGSPAQEQETLDGPWSYQWVDCCCQMNMVGFGDPQLAGFLF